MSSRTRSPGGEDGLASITGLAAFWLSLGNVFKQIVPVSSPELSVGTGEGRDIIVLCSTNYLVLFE